MIPSFVLSGLKEQQRIIMQVHGSHNPGIAKIHGKIPIDSKIGRLLPSGKKK